MRIIIAGAGGYGAEAAWVAEEMKEVHWQILGFIDDNPTRKGEKFYGYEVLGTPEEVAKSLSGEIFYHCAVGRNRTRQKLSERLDRLGWLPATLIHPTATIARGAEIGPGTYIGAGSVVAPEAKVGCGVLINTMVGVGHHSLIGNFAQICPGARVSGECRVDKFAFIGSNAVLQPGILVGEGATVGASSLAVRSVEPLVTVIGVPARIISRPAKSESPAESSKK